MEAGRGDPSRFGYVPVDLALVRKSACVEAVSARQMAELMLSFPDSAALDPGERELLAHLISRADAWLVCSPDGACVRAGKELGLLERFVSLEELMEITGQHPKLKRNYTKQWMSDFRTGLALEDGP